MDEKKVREALESLKEEVQALKDLMREDEERRFFLINVYGEHEHLNIAIEALEKQLPKKVKIEAWCPSYCPSCGYELSEDLGDGYYRHPDFIERCPNPDCSQRLDWSE